MGSRRSELSRDAARMAAEPVDGQWSGARGEGRLRIPGCDGAGGMRRAIGQAAMEEAGWGTRADGIISSAARTDDPEAAAARTRTPVTSVCRQVRFVTGAGDMPATGWYEAPEEGS
jgi:hypothetical protein